MAIDLLDNHIRLDDPCNATIVLREAYSYAWIYSHDTSTKCGAVLCNDELYPLVYGTNRFTRGIDPHTITDRASKLAYIEHAERDVIYTAAKNGIKTNGLTMVCPWACCCDCARAIVQSGITRVVAHAQAYRLTPDRWRASIDQGLHMLRVAGVKYELLDAEIGYCQGLFDGRVWKP